MKARLIRALPAHRFELLSGPGGPHPSVGDIGEPDQCWRGGVDVYFVDSDGESEWLLEAYEHEVEPVLTPEEVAARELALAREVADARRNEVRREPETEPTRHEAPPFPTHPTPPDAPRRRLSFPAGLGLLSVAAVGAALLVALAAYQSELIPQHRLAWPALGAVVLLAVLLVAAWLRRTFQ